MDRKQYSALILIATVLTCIAAWLVVPQIQQILTGLLSTRTPTTPEASNWAIIFEYHFPAGFWTVGTHEYTLKADCPNIEEASGTQTQTFEVSENATLLSGEVYLRGIGLNNSPIGGEPIAQIHPSQSTSAAVSFINSTRSQAELALSNCIVTVSWDGQDPTALTPGLPFER